MRLAPKASEHFPSPQSTHSERPSQSTLIAPAPRNTVISTGAVALVATAQRRNLLVSRSEAQSSHHTCASPPSPKQHISKRCSFLAALLIALTAIAARAADNPPVKAVAPNVLTINQGEARFYLSSDWTKPQPRITTALLVFHGKQRNADDYFQTGLNSVPTDQKNSTIVIAPQFLEETDIQAHHLPPATLRWHATAWSGGEDATAPAPVSSYDVLDAALARLSDKRLFPNLKIIIIAGHSAGSQVVSRYVAVGKGPQLLQKAGLQVHVVIANPSSWLYFSPERPDGAGNFTIPAKTCNGKYDAWKFGIHSLPRYAASLNPATLESRFMALDITILLGTADNDPNHPALDKSCSAELQGAYRLQRGESYFAYLLQRHPDTHFRLMEVDGIGHDGDAMFRSACGQHALFNTGSCNHIVH